MTEKRKPDSQATEAKRSANVAEFEQRPIFRSLKQSAEQGDVWAMTMLAHGYANLGNSAAAMAWLRHAANHGGASEKYELGFAYRKGLLTKHDLAEAEKWFTMAAAGGNVYAHCELGQMNLKYQDFGEAEAHFRFAAERGHGLAQGFLGLLYLKGEGLPQDFVLSHMWINLALAKLDYDDVEDDRDIESLRKVRDQLNKKLSKDQIAEAQRMARDWKPTE